MSGAFPRALPMRANAAAAVDVPPHVRGVWVEGAGGVAALLSASGASLATAPAAAPPPATAWPALLRGLACTPAAAPTAATVPPAPPGRAAAAVGSSVSSPSLACSAASCCTVAAGLEAWPSGDAVPLELLALRCAWPWIAAPKGDSGAPVAKRGVCTEALLGDAATVAAMALVPLRTESTGLGESAAARGPPARAASMGLGESPAASEGPACAQSMAL